MADVLARIALDWSSIGIVTCGLWIIVVNTYKARQQRKAAGR